MVFNSGFKGLIGIRSSSEREHYIGVDNYFVVDDILNVKLT